MIRRPDAAGLCPECVARGSRALLVGIEAARVRGELAPPADVQPRPSVRGMVRHLARLTGNPPGLIFGRCRRKASVDLRRAVTVTAREATGLSFPALGRLLGGRDHSTMIHLLETGEAKIARDAEFAALTERLWAAAEAEPWGPHGAEPDPAEEELVRESRRGRGGRSSELPAAAAPGAEAPVRARALPGEYVPRHALPPVMAVVDDEPDGAGEPEIDERRASAAFPGMEAGSARLLAALRREFPARCAA